MSHKKIWPLHKATPRPAAQKLSVAEDKSGSLANTVHGRGAGQGENFKTNIATNSGKQTRWEGSPFPPKSAEGHFQDLLGVNLLCALHVWKRVWGGKQPGKDRTLQFTYWFATQNAVGPVSQVSVDLHTRGHSFLAILKFDVKENGRFWVFFLAPSVPKSKISTLCVRISVTDLFDPGGRWTACAAILENAGARPDREHCLRKNWSRET